MNKKCKETLSMCLILNKEALELKSEETLLVEAAKTCVLAQKKLNDNPLYRDSFKEWWSGKFQKVALKATDNDFNYLKKKDFLVQYGSWLATVPMRKDKRITYDKKLSRLQAIQPRDVPSGENLLIRSCEYSLSLECELLEDMSFGKACAQIGHCLLKIMIEHHIPDDTLLTSNIKVTRLKTVDDISGGIYSVIKDAGLTEVSPGTTTGIIRVI